MDRALFERNLRALSPEHGELRARLSPRRGRYRFLKSRSGDTVPALIAGEESRPLHSLMDPRREAERLITSILGEGDGGCLVFFGLGGAYAIRAALERQDVHRVIALDLEGTAELLGALDYSGIFSDRRFSLLADPAPGELEAAVLRLWQPALQGGIRVIPLRPLVEFDGGGAARNGAAQGRFAQGAFAQASLEVQAAVDRLSADYSVQAWFGTRWFSNIIRNVFAVEERPPLPRVDRAAVCAAGPSLEDQMPLLAERREGCWLLSVDTALPALLAAGLEPDAVISMDCQHISYQHFMRRAPSLFLDLSSPPLLASRSCAPRFFAGGHPLARYLSRRWRSLPELDTSGANVTGAACSLAEYAGAREIELYGADFSYPLGKTYARGIYLYPWFERRQNRLAPQEAQASSFLYRDGALAKCGGPGAWY
ncbi:MAG: DUF115 domain-containing protein, partial [Spirochaetaceae bacterium]|nr:DUF115 domain-containing protein [Spirochaetaceae bacterium]